MVPSATIALADATTGALRQTKSNAQGEYEVFGLCSGTYKVTVTSSGFASKVIDKGGGSRQQRCRRKRQLEALLRGGSWQRGNVGSGGFASVGDFFEDTTPPPQPGAQPGVTINTNPAAGRVIYNPAFGQLIASYDQEGVSARREIRLRLRITF